MSKEWYDRPLKVPTLPIQRHGGLKAKANYQLTSLGTTKAENFNLAGAKGEVVMALENSAPCTTAELANETHLSPNRVKHIIEILIRDGWVRKVSGDE